MHFLLKKGGGGKEREGKDEAAEVGGGRGEAALGLERRREGGKTSGMQHTMINKYDKKELKCAMRNPQDDYLAINVIRIFLVFFHSN